MKQLYHYGQIDDRRIDKGWWEPETKAYDEARCGMRHVMMSRGEPDPDNEEIPDEVIEAYAEEHDFWFDQFGHVYERLW